MSENSGFDHFIPTLHESLPLLFKTLIKWSGLDERGYDAAVFDARFHNPPQRFSPCRNGFAFALNPRADSMVQDYLDTTQQRNDQVVQLLEILIKDWLRTRQLSVVPFVTSPTVKSRKWLSSRNGAALSRNSQRPLPQYVGVSVTVLSSEHMTLTFF